MLLQCLAEMTVVEMGVYLGCEDIFVAEKFLHLTNVGTSLQQMCGIGVSEGVRADFLGYACALGRLLYDGENHHTREFLAAITQK